MKTRGRIALVAGIAVLAIAGATGYVAYAKHQQDAATANAPGVDTRQDLAQLSQQPRLVFRNTALGDDYGRVAVVPLSDAGGPRAITKATCDRVYAGATGGICLSANRGIVTTYRSQLLDPAFAPVRELPLTGLPSRARLSRDGSLAATTTFVFGDAYTNPGQFSTRTLVSRTDGSGTFDLEQFTLLVDGKPITASDRNLWGVTFADDDIFYATAASGGRTWLVRGSLSAGKLTSLIGDVECPSLSPDKTRIAFKKHGNLPPGQWRLTVLDLASGRETSLAETHSVDDQAEWLDDIHVVYGLPREAKGSASSDIWMVPADGTGTSTVLIPDAWSPAVIR